MIPSNCTVVGIEAFGATNNNEVIVYPNPFNDYTNVVITDASTMTKAEIRIYNVIGSEVFNGAISKQTTTIGTNDLPSGLYIYRIYSNNKVIQSGRLISQQ